MLALEYNNCSFWSISFTILLKLIHFLSISLFPPQSTPVIACPLPFCHFDPALRPAFRERLDKRKAGEKSLSLSERLTFFL